MPHRYNWRRPFASSYFRSAGKYIGLKMVVTGLIGLALQFLMTHNLGRESYGLLVWATTMIAFLSPFGFPGMTTAVNGAVAKGFDGNFKRGSFVIMAGGTAGGVVLLGIAGYYWFGAEDAQKALIFLIAGVLGPGLWLDTHNYYWNGKKKFKTFFWYSTGIRGSQLIATAAVLSYSSNPVWVFLVQTGILVAANIGSVFAIIRWGKINDKFSKEYESYGWFSSKLSWVAAFADQLDKLIVGAFFGLEKLAVFAVGQLLYRYFNYAFRSFLNQIIFARLANMSISSGALWIRERQKFLFAVVGVTVCAVAVAIPTAYPFFFSEKYEDSIFYAYLFLGCAVLQVPSFFTGPYIKAHALKKETMNSWILSSVLQMICLPVFSWQWGLVGIVAARAVANLALSTYQWFLIRRFVATGVEREYA